MESDVQPEGEQHEEAVILVVGPPTNYKALGAGELALGRGAVVETTKGGVRIFCRQSSPEPVVIDTTPLVIHNDWDFVHNARAWVSLNLLRRLSGKLVFVVCVMTSSGPDDPVHNEPDVANQNFTWLHLLAYIFRGNQLAIMFLVKVDGMVVGRTVEMGITDALQRGGFPWSNITFEVFGKTILRDTVTIALGCSVYRGKEKSSLSTMGPFRLNQVKLKGKDVAAHGPWDDERVMLVGRIYSGKSTVGQMLTLGKLDPSCENFVASSSMRGQGTRVIHGDGRGYSVVEMPSVEESIYRREDSSGEKDYGFITTTAKLKMITPFIKLILNKLNVGEEVGNKSGDTDLLLGKSLKKMKNYIRSEGLFTHFIYVFKRGRIDIFEQRLWQFFQQFVGEGIKNNFTVVISDASQEWVDENMADLRDAFKGCESFLAVDFPPTEADEELESELEGDRRASLEKLEDGLISLRRQPAFGSVEGSCSSAETRVEKVNAVLTKHVMSFLKRLGECDGSRSSGHIDVQGENSFSALTRSLQWLPSNRYMDMHMP